MATTMGGTASSNGRVSYSFPFTSRDPRLNYQPRSRLDPYTEIGTSGLRQYGGFVLEEWLAQLSGKRGAWTYREMIDNSAVVGGILYAIEMLARKAEWRVEGSEEKMSNGMKATEFIETCMQDMQHAWGDTISEMLSFLPYGWSLHEEVFKKREGPQPEFADPATPETEEPDHKAASKYSDGLIGWRKLPARAQETLLRWEFAGYSSVQAMIQLDWHGAEHVIPIQKSMLFRTKAARGNPEGRSILRNAYQAYFYVQNIQTIEAIGIERDLAGIPVATPPDGVDLYQSQHEDLLTRVQEMVTSIKKDEQQGIVLPQHGWELELMSSSGSRQIDTDAVIRRYRQEIASSILADFFLVGLDGLGSYAMVDVKADLFGLSMDATLDMMCEVFNRYAIPRLLELNGAKINEPPRLNHSSAGRVDLEKVGQFLYQLAGAGVQLPLGRPALAQLFAAAGLPAEFDGESVVTEDVSSSGEGKEGRSSQDKRPMRNGSEGGGKVEKADGLIEVSPELGKRAGLLGMHLERELDSALKQLGEEAATAYMGLAKGPVAGAAAQRLATRVTKAMGIEGWLANRLGQLLRNHAGRVATDTERVLQRDVGQETRIGHEGAIQMVPEAGKHLTADDLAPQVQAALMQAISHGGTVQAVSQRIRDFVPRGRFTKAGTHYRAQLIARQETLHLQRVASLIAYQNNPHIRRVRVNDGIYGPPRSDAECIERAGAIVPIEQAASEFPSLHPQCTVSYDPIIE